MAITGIGAIVAAVVLAAFSRLCAEEITACISYIILRSVSLAAHFLPTDLHERYAEEWQSYVNELPGMVTKCFAVIGLFLAADKIRREERMQRWQDEARDSQQFYGECQAFVDEINADSSFVVQKSLQETTAQWAEIMEKVDYGRTLVESTGKFQLTFINQFWYYRQLRLIEKGFDTNRPKRAVVRQTLDEMRKDLVLLRGRTQPKVLAPKQ
jgi:hypothetical protein